MNVHLICGAYTIGVGELYARAIGYECVSVYVWRGVEAKPIGSYFCGLHGPVYTIDCGDCIAAKSDSHGQSEDRVKTSLTAGG